DANNCTLTTLISIFEPSAITQTQLNFTNITCHNFNDGTIQWLCAGGVGALSYNLQPGNVTNTTGSFANLVGSVYTLTVTDTNNCFIDTTVTIINPDQIALDSVIATDVLCFGDVNGTITAYGAGGTLPYTYTLLPVNQSNGNGQFTGLGVNTYTVTLKDINNCSVSASTEIKQPAPLLSTLDSTKNVTCYGGNDGVIKVSAIGGTIAYQFKLVPGNTVNATGLFTSLLAGTYTVIVTDANACTTQVSSIVLTSPPPIVYTSVTHQDVVCFGDNTGSITVSAAGGTGAITFNLLPNTGFQSPAGNFTALYAGTYTVVATDAVGCTMSTLVVIDQNPELIFDSIQFTEPICYGDANGTIHAFASGGVGNLTYQLDNGNPQSMGLFTNLKAGVYRITITDIYNCKKDTLFQLTEPEPVHINTLDLFPLSCIESSDGKVLVTGAGGRGNYTYYLRPGLHINRTGVFINLHDGIYTLTVKDSSGCTYDTAIVIAPAVNPMNLAITKEDLGCFGKGNEGWAQANIVGGTSPYTYLWSTNPTQTSDRASGLYFGYYFLEVTDANGCKIKDTVYIEPGPCCDQVFIPNAFSPNGDGMNDEFRITTSAGIELIQFEIYNRWGARIWSTNDFRRGWDGNYHGDSQDMNTFYYILRYKCLTDGQKYMKKGDIMIVK
nr:gliding motility-associated C-terminal domain-containing protein [Chitinophagaceae bacterium]